MGLQPNDSDLNSLNPDFYSDTDANQDFAREQLRFNAAQIPSVNPTRVTTQQLMPLVSQPTGFYTDNNGTRHAQVDTTRAPQYIGATQTYTATRDPQTGDFVLPTMVISASSLTAAPRSTFDGQASLGSESTETTWQAFTRGWSGDYLGVMENPSSSLAAQTGMYAGQVWGATKDFAYHMIGAASYDQASANWSAGNYGTAFLHGMQSLGEAGTTLVGVIPAVSGATRLAVDVVEVVVDASEGALNRMKTSTRSWFTTSGEKIQNYMMNRGTILTLTEEKTISKSITKTETQIDTEFLTFYRGDSTRQSEFLSKLGQSQGIKASEEAIARAKGQGSVSYLFENHALNSGASPYISLTTSEEVAQSFARGVNGNQSGFVTKFRLPKNFAEPNFENLNAWEREYLAPNLIENKYISNQYQVAPKP